MRRYASSKFRVLLFCMLIGVCTFAATSYGQGAPAATPSGQKQGVFTLIMNNRDFVFYLILFCSIAGVTLIIQGIIKNRRSVLMPDATINHMRELIQARQFKELIDFTENDPSFVSRAINPALKRAPSFSSMKEAMETAIGEQTAEQFRKIEYLNIIGNLGPLLGLLGTVLGMIDAFSEMQAAGSAGADPAKLAGGISKALCHTMLGLLLAVPCLASFGILRTIVDRLTVQGALIAEELLLMIKPAEAKPASAGVARPRAMPQPAGDRKVPAPPPAPLPAPQ